MTEGFQVGSPRKECELPPYCLLDPADEIKCVPPPICAFVGSLSSCMSPTLRH